MFRKVVVKDSSFSKSSPVIVRLLLVASAILMLCQTTGCTASGWPKMYEDVVIKYRDFVWAKRAYNLRYGDCRRDYAHHFSKGFQAGYSATCAGGDGYVPALPPKDYRSFEYQTADGARCVNSWFEGYPAGVAAAKKDQAGTYHDILISRLIDSAIKQEKIEPVLPEDVPVVAKSSAAEGEMPSVETGNGDAGLDVQTDEPSVTLSTNEQFPEDDSMRIDGSKLLEDKTPVTPAGYQMPNQGSDSKSEEVSWGGWNSSN